jgi:FKBP-type peptidyl-prolyl cis-trans isomerase FkpA
MQFSKTILGVLSVAMLFAACNSVDFKKTKAGVPYKVFGNGKGDSIKQNNSVKFEVIQKTKDSVLYSSYKMGQPQFIQIQPIPATFSYNDIGSNIMEIFMNAKNGDSIYMVQSTDSLIKQNPQMAEQAKIKKGQEFITTIKVLEVFKTPEEAQAAVNKDRIANADKMEKESLEKFKKDTAAQAMVSKDAKTIEAYLAKNNIQAQKTSWGVYVQILNPGQGPKLKVGQYGTVRYKGHKLSGEVFDSGTFPLQAGMGGSIPGFDMGARELAKGGKANVYIPSTLAYGPNGSGPKIGPNEILVFEMELLDISDTPPAQNPQGNIDTTRAQKQ